MSDRNPTDLNAQRLLEREQQTSAQLERDQELNEVKSLMEHPAGRRFMWRLLDKSGLFRTSFTGNSTTFFNEGQRNIGLIYMSMINETCPELYHLMVIEAVARKVSDE